jgi:hypothetical protein
MGEVVSLEAHRRRRLGAVARRLFDATDARDPIDRLEEAVRGLDALLTGSRDIEPLDRLVVASELRAVTGAVTRRRYLDAALRAERLLDRLRRTS